MNDSSNDTNAELMECRQAEALAQKHLATFDALDFEVYSNQKWDRLGESHALDILVHYPDGHTTRGLSPHIDELTPMFVFAPDTRIEAHPIRIGTAEWTSVVGVMKGTFTQPMPIGNGQTIQPTGKPFVLYMSTVAHWTNDLMDEEWLFWDNQSLMKQIGVAE